MRRTILIVGLLLFCSLSAQAQRFAIHGQPDRRDPLQVVNTLVLDSRTGRTTSGNNFGIEYHYQTLRTGLVSSMYTPHSGNMQLVFPNAATAVYQGDAWQNVCRDSRPRGGDWRRVNGTMRVEITTLRNGRRHVKCWFSPDKRDQNARIAVSGLVFEFTLNSGDVLFRLNY
jgi:hypothetical protein